MWISRGWCGTPAGAYRRYGARTVHGRPLHAADRFAIQVRDAFNQFESRAESYFLAYSSSERINGRKVQWVASGA